MSKKSQVSGTKSKVKSGPAISHDGHGKALVAASKSSSSRSLAVASRANDSDSNSKPDHFGEPVVEPKLLTGVIEVNTTQRQFPIPVKKSRTHGRSGRKAKGGNKAGKDELLTTGPPSLYGNWRCFLLDRHQLEARMINRYRVQGKKDFPCYIYDEIHKYSNNAFYRNLMVGSTLGAALYFMTLIFVILPETNEKFTPFKEQRFSLEFIPLILLAILVVFLIRLCSFLYASPYLLALMQVAILALTVLGNHEIECKRFSNLRANKNSTRATVMPAPLTGGGQLPVALMASFESCVGLEPDALRRSLMSVRCDQSLRKYCAVNLLGELINFILTIRLIFI